MLLQTRIMQAALMQYSTCMICYKSYASALAPAMDRFSLFDGLCAAGISASPKALEDPHSPADASSKDVLQHMHDSVQKLLHCPPLWI